MTGILLGISLLIGAAGGVAGAVLILGAALVAMIGWGAGARIALLCAAIALLGAWRVQPADVRNVLTSDEAAWIDGDVFTGPLESGSAQRFTLSGERAALLCVTAPVAPRLVRGDRVSVLGSAVSVDDADPSYAAFLRSRGCGGTVDARDLRLLEGGTGWRSKLDGVRRDLTVALQRAAPGDRGSLLAGLVTGDDTALTRDSRDAFIATGTTHVTAVSGSNLALITALLAIGGVAVGRLRSASWQIGTVAVLWTYVVMIGAAPPAFRAAFVASVAIVGMKLGRRPDLVTIGVLVAAAEVAIRPGDFASLSYRLSTAAALALILGLAGRRFSGVRGWLFAGVVATTVTQVATAPFLVPIYGGSGPIAIPANLIVAPLCALAFPFALIGGICGMASEGLGGIITAPAQVIAAFVLEAVRWMAALPGSDAPITSMEPVPAWLLAAIAMAVVAAMSVDCRGGIMRVARASRQLTPRQLAAVTGGGTGTLVALLTVLLAR